MTAKEYYESKGMIATFSNDWWFELMDEYAKKKAWEAWNTAATENYSELIKEDELKRFNEWWEENK